MAGLLSSEEADPDFQIAPMVDVVFVLMLFFMACAGARQPELFLRTDLPAGSGKQSASLIVIEISPEGLVSMNNQAYGQPGDKALESLKAWLENHAQIYGAADAVIIRPSPDARHERIIDVLNAAAHAKIRNLSFG
jgi:biopolymer transport protein ExbD